jgi:hypothetical protein
MWPELSECFNRIFDPRVQVKALFALLARADLVGTLPLVQNKSSFAL